MTKRVRISTSYLYLTSIWIEVHSCKSSYALRAQGFEIWPPINKLTTNNLNETAGAHSVAKENFDLIKIIPLNEDITYLLLLPSLFLAWLLVLEGETNKQTPSPHC